MRTILLESERRTLSTKPSTSLGHLLEEPMKKKATPPSGRFSKEDPQKRLRGGEHWRKGKGPLLFWLLREE